MFYHFFSPRLYLILTIIFSSNSFAVEDKSTPEDYIKYGISKQKSDPDEANKALHKAYTLAKQKNNRTLMSKAILEQAQVAKLHKNYRIAQQYLSKAESISSSLDDIELQVTIFFSGLLNACVCIPRTVPLIAFTLMFTCFTQNFC